ncbi:MULTISPECIES: DUF2909 domain-containing protein [Vibrio]|uniref:DUF2909 family protein n=1 Tax=Vibrio algicola TaxID=2662262 RepID=A0A5Q0TGA9_9VIBR|nr:MULTISPECIES: DUF2909 domain-containing protein [Vibrio]MBD1577449.1 DUF2909 domain-containing protein [Vibrio sp. S11_S32]
MTAILLIKFLLVVLILFIFYNLARALYVMVRESSDNENSPINPPSMTHFIGRRLLFAVCVMLFLIFLMASGIITPNPRPY